MLGPALITLEGVDGSGKSSQVGRIVEWLRRRGAVAVVVREPGGTPLGEALREVLLHDPRGRGMEAATETLLMAAARSELVRKVIAPALRRGLIVVSDRFADSTVAYQGYGRGLDPAWIAAVHGEVLAGVRPDLTLLFDLPPEQALARLQAGSDDHIEGRGLDFLRRVRQGYLALAAGEPERFCVIDAGAAPEAVWEQVETCLAAFFGRRRRAEGEPRETGRGHRSG